MHRIEVPRSKERVRETMGDMGELFRARREADKERKAKNLAAADPSGWTQHTELHWSRTLNGKRLDYWPSRNKFQYDGIVRTGDVVGFIKNRERSQTDCRDRSSPRDRE